MTQNKEYTADESVATDGGIVRRRIQPNPETAEYDFLQIVAELDGADVEHLPSLWHDLDGMVSRLFETPPAPESEVELTFLYDGYRVTIDRSGRVTLKRAPASTE